MKVYITKYALTTGIMVKEVNLNSNISDKMVTEIKATGYLNSYHKPYWHENKNEALEHCELLRKKKIFALKKQMTKLEQIDFSKQLES